jgi:hypothetical protein
MKYLQIDSIVGEKSPTFYLFTIKYNNIMIINPNLTQFEIVVSIATAVVLIVGIANFIWEISLNHCND